MKKVYIVLTHTGTTLSKIIKIYTRHEFSHVSISLDADLKEMYSFGRMKPYNPFIGGFVHEYINRGTFKRFFNTKTKIYSLEITESQYEKVRNNIKQIEGNREKYKFNILGLIAAGFNMQIASKYSFYCAEFVKYVLEKSEVNTELPKIVKPEDFKNIKGLQEVYTGFLKKYKSKKTKPAELLRENMLLYTKDENKNVC